MASTSPEAKRRQTITVAVVLGAVALFAALFLLVASLLQTDMAQANPVRDSLVAGEEAQDAVTADPFYVLLIGSDSRKGTALYTGNATEHAQVDQHSDIMTLVRVDPTAYVLTLLSVPRDTQLAGEEGKINDSFLQGKPEETVKAVERLTGASIDYYMMTTFMGFESLVNALGGVEVDVPVKVTVPDAATGRDLTVKAGQEQRLNGAQALVLARARKAYEGNQDGLRQVNVRALETSLIEEALDDPDEVEQAVRALKGNVQTNMPLGQIASLGLDFALHKDQVVIYSGTGPYEGETNKAGQWVAPEDKELWARVMETVDAGGDPTTVLQPPCF